MRGRKLAVAQYGIGTGIVLAAIAMRSGDGYFLSQVSLFSILAIGGLSTVLVVGIAGQVSFGQAGFLAIGAYSVGILVTKVGWPFAVNVIVATLAAALLGLVTGIPALRIRGHYLAVVTVGVAEIVRLVANDSEDLTGGANGLPGIRRPVVAGQDFGDVQLNIVLIFGLLVMGVISANLVHSRAGLGLRILASSEQAATVCGVRIWRSKVGVFALSSAFLGFAGALDAYYLQFISPSLFTVEYSIQAFTVAAIGGFGSLGGVLPGALVVTVIPTLFQDLVEWITLILAAVIALVLIYAPDGLAVTIGRAVRAHAPWRDRSGSVAEAGQPEAATSEIVPRSYAEEPGVVCLVATSLDKRYGGVHAVRQVSLECRSSEILALIGPNGAGKSTVLNLVSGLVKLDSGRVLVGASGDQPSPAALAGAGVRRTFQHPQLLRDNSVLENVMVGAHGLHQPGYLAHMLRSPRARQMEQAVSNMAMEAIQAVGLSPSLAARKPRELPYGTNKLIEVARAICGGGSVLLLDEPAAGLNDYESARLGDVLSSLRESGWGILLVEHNIPLVMRVADWVVVLSSGAEIAAGTAEDVKADPHVIEAYLGRGSGGAPAEGATTRAAVHA